MSIRALVLSDSHLGFDLPTAPRVRRRRRGDDFVASYRRSLAPALAGEADLVVHAGDVFHRPRVGRDLAYQAFAPLKRIAEAGTPVFVVPGNHERSRMPHSDLLAHPHVHLFDAPRAFRVAVGGVRVAVAGFPYQRRGVRSRLPALIEATGVGSLPAEVKLLCVHHCVEGATVGPADFTFRHGPDVIRGADIPEDVAAVVSGHVHRHQLLTTTLSGRPLAAPVLYPGSLERTAFAEIGEQKGYLELTLSADVDRPGGRLAGWRFVRLPTRPMVVRERSCDGLSADAVERLVREVVASVPRDAVLRLRLGGRPLPGARRALSAARLRSVAPPEMNLDVVLVDEPRPRGVRRRRRSREPAPDPWQNELALGEIERGP